MSKRTRVRIGCAAGFWGDTETAAAQLLEGGELDYLVFDYLAEITMSIMAGARLRRPDGGHAHDFVTRVMRHSLADALTKGVRVVTNAGGVNPQASRDALRALSEELGVSPRIALVTGDDLMPQKDALSQLGIREMTTGDPLPARLLTMNAYLGARPIAEALHRGADIVITGRVADSALVLGPLMHEFAWAWDDYDRLAQGSLAGHIIECGAQATGGIFTDWEDVGDYENIGFPIAECYDDASFVLEKPIGTGGLITPAVVYEQLLYEIGDPRAYLLPDVVCDFTRVNATPAGENRVLVRGARGRPAPERLKVSATYPDGFKTSAAFLLAGESAPRKGERVARALLHKTERLLRDHGFAPFRDTCIDVLGAEATYGPHRQAIEPRECVVRIAASHEDGNALKRMLRELPQAGTGMAPGFTGGVGGRPSPSPMIRLFSFLISRDHVQMEIDLDGRRIPVTETRSDAFDAGTLPPQNLHFPPCTSDTYLPLLRLAHGRSGDKGDTCNIGIVARHPDYLPYIGAALTEDAVFAYMAHVLHPEKGRVRRYALPGCHGLNFVLEHSLGGGGMASLRADPQGKAFAQQLLAFPVPVPAPLYETLRSRSHD